MQNTFTDGTHALTIIWNSSDRLSRENSVEKPISFSGLSVLTLVGVLSSWVRVNHILHGFIILGSINETFRSVHRNLQEHWPLF